MCDLDDFYIPIDAHDIIQEKDNSQEEGPSKVLLSFWVTPPFKETFEIQENRDCFITSGTHVCPKKGEEEKDSKAKAPAIVIVGYSKEIIEETPLKLCYMLDRITKIGCGECSITTKTGEEFDVCTYRYKEKSVKECIVKKEGFKQIHKTFEKYLEKINEKDHLDEITKEDILKLDQYSTIYRCGGLMMYNIDSGVEIDSECLSYMNMLVDKWLLSNVNMPVCSDSLFRMIPFAGRKPDIPILLKKGPYKYEDHWEEIKEHPQKEDYRPKGNVLGYYTRKDEDKCNGPHIVLFPETIQESANNNTKHFKVLMAKVLVHEIAHALMDKYRIVDGDSLCFTDSNKNWPVTLEAKAMEESLANAMTLYVFKKYATNEDYKYVYDYIFNQPAIYQFGIWQEQIAADWKKWYDSSKQDTSNLKEWFNKCFGNGSIIILQKDYIQEMFNDVFRE